MPKEQSSQALSRRHFVQRSAATAGATAAVVGAGGVTAAAPPAGAVPGATDLAGRTLVAATVVRASHSREKAGTLALGVRASVLTPDGHREALVVVVEPVDFGQPTAQVNAQIAEAVRAKAADFLSNRSPSVEAEDIVVQVFGGAL